MKKEDYYDRPNYFTMKKQKSHYILWNYTS